MTARPTFRRVTGAVASLSLMAAGATLLTGTTAVAADDATPADRGELAFTTTTKPGIAGQYQIAASDDTGDLFVTSAKGRPPVTVATLARVNPETLAVEQTADLPIIKHGADGAQFKRLSTHGIYVDDTHDNVWVTNTRDNQVSVYDRESLEYVAGTYDFAGPVTQTPINHPREVVVDEVRNLAYVTAANRGGSSDSSITVYSTEVAQDQVIEPLAQIAIPARMDYPAAGDEAYAVTMGLDIDEATGKVYANDFRTDEYYVIDGANDYDLTRHAIPNPTVGDDGLGKLQPSSIAIDPDSNELYSVNQTQGTTATSLNVFNLSTGEFKYSLTTGPRALAVDVDRVRDLVYVADFENGSVTVVDTRTRSVIETTEPTLRPTNDEGVAAARSANHLIVAGGSAYLVDKAGATPAEIDYALNVDTGAIEAAAVDLDSITRITPQAEAAVVGAAHVGTGITLEGQGWLTKSGLDGSTVAVKVDRGAIAAPDGTDIWATINADADGTFTATIPVPAGSALVPGTYTLNLLSGSLKEGDTGRMVPVEVTVGAQQAVKSTKKPTIKGKTKVGKKLKASKGSWNTTVTVNYQWQRNGKAIKGATKAKYKVTKKDQGKKLKVKVTASADGWTNASATSKAVKIKKAKKKK